jgi:DNA-binding transcriptional MerR regulator
MLKISEFARIGLVSIATLRHYDQYGLLKPAMLDQDTGYRYYTLDQLPRLNRILALKDLGFPLEQISQLLENALSFEQLQGMFKLKQARLARIAARLHQIEQEGKMPTYEVLLKQVDTLHIASIRATIPLPLQTNIQWLYATINTYLDQQRVQHTQPSMLLLHSRSEQRDDGLYIDAEAAIPVPATVSGNGQITIRILPAGLIASTVHIGNDLSTGQAHIALYRWMQNNDYRIIAPPRQVHLLRGASMDVDQYVTEVQFPVEKCT